MYGFGSLSVHFTEIELKLVCPILKKFCFYKVVVGLIFWFLLITHGIFVETATNTLPFTPIEATFKENLIKIVRADLRKDFELMIYFFLILEIWPILNLYKFVPRVWSVEHCTRDGCLMEII